MTKADIFEKGQAGIGLTKKESAEMVEAVISIMKSTLESGENLKISGFGSFIVKQKANRRGRNPQTGETLTIKARSILTFKPSTISRQAINGKTKGRRAEDGAIPEQYPMIELESPESCYRTEKNVIESDGTLILNKGVLSEGTKLTHDFTIKNGKPSPIVQLDGEEIIKPEHVVRWLNGQYISVLNIAGPRESKCPNGIHSKSFSYLGKGFHDA